MPSFERPVFRKFWVTFPPPCAVVCVFPNTPLEVRQWIAAALVTPARATALGHPANAKLSGLNDVPGALPAAIWALMSAMASGRLLLGSPPRDAVVGMVTTDALPIAKRSPSYAPKKNNLSFLMGPPMDAPNCSS